MRQEPTLLQSILLPTLDLGTPLPAQKGAPPLPLRMRTLYCCIPASSLAWRPSWETIPGLRLRALRERRVSPRWWQGRRVLGARGYPDRGRQRTGARGEPVWGSTGCIRKPALCCRDADGPAPLQSKPRAASSCCACAFLCTGRGRCGF